MNRNSRELLQLLRSVGRANIDAFANCDTEFVRAQTAPVFTSIRKIRAASQFIRIMEERKGQKKGLSAAEERECLQRATELAHEARDITARTWRVVQHLETAGTLEHMLSAVHELVRNRGTIRTSEIWDTVLGADGVADYFNEMGLGEEAISEFAEVLRSHDRVFKILDGTLVAEPPSADSGSRGSPASSTPARRILIGRRKRPISAKTLWEEDSLSAAISAIEQPGILGIEVFRESDFGGTWKCPEYLDPVDLLVAEGAIAVQQLESSVSAMAHSGLPIHRGGDPWFWIFVAIVAAVVVAASVAIVIVCFVDDGFKSEHSTLCDAASWLTFIGFMLLMGTACAEGANCKVVVSVQGKGSQLLATDPTMGSLT